MTKLQELLEEKYPDSEISHIQREAFEEGYKAGDKAAHELFNEHIRAMEGMRVANQLGEAYNSTHY